MAHPVQSIDDLWNKVSGSDQVDVVGALLLQLQKNLCQPLDADLLAKMSCADGVVLAEDAAQRAAGKKDRPGALLTADTGFLPKVQSGAGKLDRIAHTAATGEKAAVNAAVSWTEGTRV